MKYCKTCNVHYDAPLEQCLLCNGELEYTKEIADEPAYKFKIITKKSSSRFWYRFFFFLAVVSTAITIYLDYMDGLSLSWSLIVAITTLYTVLIFRTLSAASQWSAKVMKILMITAVGTILIGFAIRDYAWSIDYIFPFSIIGNILLISILTLVNKKHWFDYFASLIIITIIGLLPGLLDLLEFTTVSWPSFVCFSYSSITLLAIIFLPSKSSREEFKRRFHV
jgi:hypothetical protein